MEFLGYGAAAALALILGGLLAVWMVFFLIKSLIRLVARKAIGQVVDLGSELSGATVDSVMQVGERELATGVDTIKGHIKHEWLTSSPVRMATEVTRLARERQGVLSPSVVMAELSVSEKLARKTLNRLARQQVCRRGKSSGDGGAVYFFHDFQNRRRVKLCDYCNANYQPDHKAGGCSSCGAPLRLTTTTVS